MRSVYRSSSKESVFDYVQARESRARSYADAVGRVLVRGLGMRVYDDKGNDYLDCLSCAGVLALGHNNPDIRQKVVAFLESDSILQCLDITTPVKAQFIESLLKVLPPAVAERAKIQFCGPTGADATEAAVKLFKTATGRHTVISFHGAYHGVSAGALALTGNLARLIHEGRFGRVASVA